MADKGGGLVSGWFNISSSFAQLRPGPTNLATGSFQDHDTQRNCSAPVISQARSCSVLPMSSSAARLSVTPAATSCAQTSSMASSKSTVPQDKTSTPSRCEVGTWMCASDGKSFMRCIMGGTWSVSMDTSKGTSCIPGVWLEIAWNQSSTSNDLQGRQTRDHRYL